METILGALGGFIAAYVIARFQASREDRYRFATLKQTKYAEFVRLSRDHMRTINMQMAARVAHPGQPITGLPELESTEPIDHLSAEIALLTGERVWQASRDVYDALIELDPFARDASRPPYYVQGDVDVKDYPDRVARFNESLDAFLTEAKKDLGTSN